MVEKAVKKKFQKRVGVFSPFSSESQATGMLTCVTLSLSSVLFP